jgi:hypothetical protein
MRNGHSLSFRAAVLSVCLLTLLFATPNGAPATKASVAPPVAGQLNDQADVLSRAASYLESFGSRIPALVCDERFQLRASIGDRVTVRTVKSAAGFTRVDEPLGWFAVREVEEFNGRKQPVRPDRFTDVLEDPPATRATRLQSMLNEAAEFMPSLADRRLSNPLFGLQVVEGQHQPRFAFTLKGEEKISGKAVRQIDFVERSPAFVQDDAGRDILARGSVWVAADGAIARTRVEFEAPVDRPVRGLKGVTTVNFAPNEKLAVWVPASLLERQEQRFIDSASNIETEASATFQDCRLPGR